MADEKQSQRSITEELNRLGTQLGEAMRLAWESEDRRRLQSEVVEGIRQFGEQVDRAAQQAREHPTTQQLRDQARRMTDRLQESNVVDDVRQGLVTGLEALNRELNRLVTRMQQESGTGRASTAGTGTAAPTEAAPSNDVPAPLPYAPDQPTTGEWPGGPNPSGD